MPFTWNRRSTPRELRQPFTNHIALDVEFERDRDGRGSIEHVVFARNVQMERAQIVLAVAQLESALKIPALQAASLEIGLRASAVSDGAAIDARQNAAARFRRRDTGMAAP